MLEGAQKYLCISRLDRIVVSKNDDKMEFVS